MANATGAGAGGGGEGEGAGAGRGLYVEDADKLAVVSHDFFAEFIPDVLLIFLVFAAFTLITFVWTTLWGFMLRKCRLPEHWVRLTQYLWAVTLLLFGLAAAFGAVGIDFGQLFLGFGLFSIAFSTGVGSTIANVFSGIMLQTHGLYEHHDKVRLLGYNNLTGRIESMNLLHVRITPEPSASSDGFSPQTVLVPNTIFTSTPVEVMWKEAPRKSASRYTQRQYVAKKSPPPPQKDVEQGVSGTRRQAPGPDAHLVEMARRALLDSGRQQQDLHRRRVQPHGGALKFSP